MNLKDNELLQNIVGKPHRISSPHSFVLYACMNIHLGFIIMKLTDSREMISTPQLCTEGCVSSTEKAETTEFWAGTKLARYSVSQATEATLICDIKQALL